MVLKLKFILCSLGNNDLPPDKFTTDENIVHASVSHSLVILCHIGYGSEAAMGVCYLTYIVLQVKIRHEAWVYYHEIIQ